MALRFLNNGYFAGKVGIGTDTPGAKLEIATTGGVAKPDALRISNGAFPTYLWDIWRDNTTGYLNIGSTTNGIDDGALVTIKDVSGNVGIGTTAPIVKLDVVGTARFADVSPRIVLQETGTAKDFSLKINTDGRLSFLNDDLTSEVLTIKQDGNVGIGTTGPNRQ